MDPELTPEQEAFRAEVAAFARAHVAPAAASIDASGRFPIDLVREAAARGYLGLLVPEQHGGRGIDHVRHALAIEAIAYASATVAVILAVHNALVCETLAVAGTPEQQAAWLPRLARGELLGAFALSEADAGTDAANQQTLAVRDGDGYRLDGRKVWVANGEVAGVAIVFAATAPGQRGRGISAFVVPLDRPGITRAPGVDSLGVRGLGCVELVFDGVRVRDAERIGAENAGFPIARRALEAGRLAIAAQALGVGRAALDAALDHARTRHTFGRPIASYQAIQWFLADMATDLEAARLLALKASWLADQGDEYGADAAMAKLAASEAAHRAADRAMQMHASAGYRRGSLVERLFRDVRATEIYQGTSEVQRMIIAAAAMRNWKR
ncbi:MAG TPA: acyl-CoA dehydrogenase family protein [Vicinamibacterales bacterium]